MEFYRDKDIEKLFAEGISLEQINEIYIGRTLEKVYDANAKLLYSTIALKTTDIENIELKTIHWNTTSKNLSGNYDVYSEEEADEETSVYITYGYSKELFVLMKNQGDKEKLTTEEILLEYKNQYSVESAFRIIKSPSYVDAIFLKKPERIEAFGYLMVIGILLLNVIKRRIRKELSKEEEALPDNQKRILKLCGVDENIYVKAGTSLEIIS